MNRVIVIVKRKCSACNANTKLTLDIRHVPELMYSKRILVSKKKNIDRITAEGETRLVIKAIYLSAGLENTFPTMSDVFLYCEKSTFPFKCSNFHERSFPDSTLLPKCLSVYSLYQQTHANTHLGLYCLSFPSYWDF